MVVRCLPPSGYVIFRQDECALGLESCKPGTGAEALQPRLVVARNCSDRPEPRYRGAENQAMVSPRAVDVLQGRGLNDGYETDDLLPPGLRAYHGLHSGAQQLCMQLMGEVLRGRGRGRGRSREQVWDPHRGHSR